MVEERGVQRTREGEVVSDAMNKTCVVLVQRRITHPLYSKQIRRAKKFYVHDEENQAKKGDRVRIAETRPTSKLKRWRLVEVLNATNAGAE